MFNNLKDIFHRSISSYTIDIVKTALPKALQWRHNEREGVANHRRLDGLLKRLFHAQIKENIKAPRHLSLRGESTGHRRIPLTKGWRLFYWASLVIIEMNKIWKQLKIVRTISLFIDKYKEIHLEYGWYQSMFCWIGSRLADTMLALTLMRICHVVSHMKYRPFIFNESLSSKLPTGNFGWFGNTLNFMLSQSFLLHVPYAYPSILIPLWCCCKNLLDDIDDSMINCCNPCTSTHSLGLSWGGYASMYFWFYIDLRHLSCQGGVSKTRMSS